MIRSIARNAFQTTGRTVLLALALLPWTCARAADRALVPGITLTESAAAGKTRRLRVELKRGEAAELRLRQLDATGLVLRWDEGAMTAVLRTEAGREATLRVTLVADADRVWLIGIASANSKGAARYALVLGPPHAVTAVDRERAAAALALAQGQAVQRGEAPQAATRAGTLYDAAIAHGRQATDACGLRLAYATQSRLDYGRGDYRAAQAAAESALSQTCSDDFAERAMAWHALAVAQATQGDAAASAEAEERALVLVRRTGDLARQAAVLGNLAVQYRLLGETQKALDTAQTCLRIAAQIGDTRRTLFIHQAIADVYLARAELAPAIAAYRRVLDDARATPLPLVEGMGWANLGLAYYKSGDNDEAYRAWGKADSVCTPANDWSCLAVVAANRGDARYFGGEFSLAAAEYARAFEIAEAHNLKLQQAYALAGLGACDMKAKRWNEARVRLAAARDQMRAVGALREQAYLATLLGDLAGEQLDFAEARRQYRQALESGQRYGDRGVQWLALGNLARNAQQGGDLAHARLFIERALTLIENERTAISDPGLRTSYFDSMRAYYDLYIDILMQLETREPGHGHAGVALIAAERARARSLQEQLAERAIEPDAALDPALRDAERAAQDRVQTLAYRIARLDSNEGGMRTAMLSEVDEASHRLDEARGRIRAADPRYADLAHPVALTLSGIQRDLLDDDAAVIEYWLGASRSYAWIVTRTTVQAWVLPPRTAIERSIGAVRDAVLAQAVTARATSIEQLATLQARDAAALEQRTRALVAQILPPGARDALRTNVAVVADGDLQRLPFGLLDPARRFAYLPSLATLRALRALPASRAARNTVAVLADPVFRADDARLHGGAAPATVDEVLLRAASEAGVATLPRLPNTRREAKAIGALSARASSWVALDFAANRTAALHARWADYSVVHFATHALLNLQHPELSGIVLSLFDADGRPEDGFLRINDIYALHMPADLVVLSVCDSALGKSRGSEGAFSLSRAFFYAGARRVVASLWPVDDRASVAFMSAFYDALLGRGLRAQDALLEAQRSVQRNPRWSAPYYWGGYVLQGDWR